MCRGNVWAPLLLLTCCVTFTPAGGLATLQASTGKDAETCRSPQTAHPSVSVVESLSVLRARVRSTFFRQFARTAAWSSG
jgi:hypothetical protein